MSIIQGTAKGGSASFYDYPIGDSLRFDGSSYLSRTPTIEGSSTVWTLSMWLKRASTSTGSHYILARGNTHFSFGSDNFAVNLRASTTNHFYITNAVYRDLSSWYHFVISCNLGNSGSDKLKVYLNGELISNLDLSNTTYQNATTTLLNTTEEHAIGRYSGSEPYYVGYLANIQLIDGQAVDQYFFGEFKDNIWVPYNAFSTAGSGTATASDGDTATDSYGTNGFHLTFKDGIESLPVSGYTGNQNAFRDKSHNTNHWKIN